MRISIISGLVFLIALATSAAAQNENTVLVEDPCEKPCITEISTVPWQGPALRPQPKVVYGEDDRIDVYQETDAQRQQWASATCALINLSRLTQHQDGTWTISSPAEYLRSGLSACDDEPFGDQPTAAFCTGFVVGEDLIVTAGHCYTTTSLATVRFVFGFWMEDAATPRLEFLENEVLRSFSGTCGPSHYRARRSTLCHPPRRYDSAGGICRRHWSSFRAPHEDCLW